MKAIFGKTGNSRMSENDLAQLFNDYQKLVYRTAFFILGSREEAEDVLQDVFIKIYQSFSTYDASRGALSTWIHRITVNHCIQRKTRSLWRFLPLFKEHEVQPDKSNSKLEEDRELMETLSRLSAAQRTLVVLRYGWQLPYEEIAQIMGIPLGTVKSRHAKVIKILQDYYNSTSLSDLIEEEIQ